MGRCNTFTVKKILVQPFVGLIAPRHLLRKKTDKALNV